MARTLTTKEEQLRLIEECRASGLTDTEWCLQHGIRPKTFYTWIYRMRQRGEIDIPATIPTPIPKQVKQPEIVKIQVEARPAEVPVDAQSVERPVMSSILPVQSGIPVMEVTIEGIQLRVTNDINPQMLAQTIQFLRGYGC